MLATIGTSAVTLVGGTSGASSSYPNYRGIQLIASPLNTSTVYFGKSSSVATSGATTAGLVLQPGVPVCIPPDFAADANLLYLIGGAASQLVYWDMIKANP